MAAVFCEYDRAKGGTLLPIEYTATWDMTRAEYLATPLLAATYVEGGIDKGVLVVQRQIIVENEVAWSHATSAVVSVYVFKRAGARWQFEKGAKEALDAGAKGNAAGAELIKLGDDRFGLWFEGGDIHQGYTNCVRLHRHAEHGSNRQGRRFRSAPRQQRHVLGRSERARQQCAQVLGIREPGVSSLASRAALLHAALAYKGTENPDPTDDEQIATQERNGVLRLRRRRVRRRWTTRTARPTSPAGSATRRWQGRRVGKQVRHGSVRCRGGAVYRCRVPGCTGAVHRCDHRPAEHRTRSTGSGLRGLRELR